MRKHFPPVDVVSHEWVNVCEQTGLNVERFAGIFESVITSEQVLIEVHRKLGTLVPWHQAVAFVAEHVGKGQIRIDDREFSSFVVIATNGVATAWRNLNTSPA